MDMEAGDIYPAYLFKHPNTLSQEPWGQTHLLYIQVGDVHVHQAALHTLHHTIFLEVTEEVPHDGRCQAADPLAQNVWLETLQEDALSHRVLHQPRVDLVKQQVPEKNRTFASDRMVHSTRICEFEFSKWEVKHNTFFVQVGWV